jgi:hypothetical protein
MVHYVKATINLKQIEGILIGPTSLTFRALHQRGNSFFQAKGKKFKLDYPDYCVSLSLEKRTFDFIFFHKKDVINFVTSLAAIDIKNRVLGL